MIMIIFIVGFLGIGLGIYAFTIIPEDMSLKTTSVFDKLKKYEK
jgi:hypothetical protein